MFVIAPIDPNIKIFSKCNPALTKEQISECNNWSKFVISADMSSLEFLSKIVLKSPKISPAIPRYLIKDSDKSSGSCLFCENIYVLNTSSKLTV